MSAICAHGRFHTHVCSCLSCASILIRDIGQSSQGSKEQQAPACQPVTFTALTFHNIWFSHRMCLLVSDYSMGQIQFNVFSVLTNYVIQMRLM